MSMQEPCALCGVVEWAYGVKYEQERIIKLLEAYFRPEEAKAIYPADYEQYLDIIALIKGENNG